MIESDTKNAPLRYYALDIENRLGIDKQPTDKFHFLLLVRPGAASSSTSIQSQLDSVGASFGFDVIGANRSIKLRSEVRN